MIDADELYIKYFEEDMRPFPDYEIDEDNIEEVLRDNNEEYDDGLISDILHIIKEEQEQVNNEAILEEASEFKCNLYEYLNGLSTEYHLDDEEIGKILLSMANEYLNENYY